MLLKMRPHGWVLMQFLACGALAGCHTGHRPVTHQELVGTYTYVSNDPDDVPVDHNLNRLTLKADGTYDLVQGGTAKVVSEKKGIWVLIPSGTFQGQPANVQLDLAGYPVQIKGDEVRLMVDYDTGIWWEKVK